MSETLTGEAAAGALQMYMRLGSVNARFDRRKIAFAAQTRAGRLKVAFSIRSWLGKWRKAPAPDVPPPPVQAPKQPSSSPARGPTDVSSGKKKPRIPDSRGL